MIYYDRYFGKTTSELPRQMDLGRFAVVNESGIRDLTNSELPVQGDYVIRESLFEYDNKDVHDILKEIALGLNQNFYGVNPIIQKFNIEIKHFEDILDKNLSHLRSIVSNPHSLLNKDTQKVNIGRAKRISSRSYQHLSHHSEDWEKLSVLSPKPRKILHEELIVEYEVYENILFRAFLQEAIKHLNTRIKETANITKFFLSIFDPKEYIDAWSDKIDRSHALVGRAIKSDKSKDSGATNRTLVALKLELVKLEHSRLFEDFPKHMSNTLVYHDTNVLNSHKHYKYLKMLWLELKKLKGKSDDVDPYIFRQEVMNNMRVYVESLFVYTLRQMDYVMTKNENMIRATHDSLPTIDLDIDKYGVLHISTDDVKFNIITLGGIYEIENALRLPQDTYCFCFSDYQKPKNNVEGIYFVNPIDTNSIEYSGQVIRMLIIQKYIAILNKKMPFKHSLRDFVSLIGCKDIIFDKISFTYSFGKELPNNIDENNVTSIVKESQEFKQRNRRDQETLLSDMSGLIHEINEKCSAISKTIVCPKCSKQYRSRDLRYLVCDCGFICDLSSQKGKLFHSQKDSSYSNITQKGWGMDYIE